MNALSPQIADALVGSTALTPIAADAELIATCAAFCELERAYDTAGGGLEDDSAQPERDRIVAEQDRLMDRLVELPCTTLAGVQAMGRALAAWDRELLRDVPAKDTGDLITSHLVERLLALPQLDPNLDTDLLSRRNEMLTAVALFNGINLRGDIPDKESDAIVARCRKACAAIIDCGPARTSEGIALKAAAAMQLLRSAFDFDVVGEWPGLGEEAAWHVLSELAGNAYIPPAYPTDSRLAESEPPRRNALGTPFEHHPAGADADADLLALRPEFDRLHALMIDYNKDLIPDGGTECADFDALCAWIATAVPAVTMEGRAFQAAAAMHHLTYRLSEGQQVRNPAWQMLKGIAGAAFQSVEVPR